MQTSKGHTAGKLTYLHELYQRAATFILRDLWIVDPAVFPVPIRLVLQPLRVMIIVVHGFFFGHQCLLRASSLTFTTLLALVPLLAFMFAFLKGLGVQNLIEPLLIQEFSSVGSKEVMQLILDFVKNVKVGTLSVFSLIMLLFTTLWQLRAIERALAEVSFACQYASTYPFESFGISPSIYTKEWLASSLYFSLTQAFTTGTGPWSVMMFAQQHRIPIRLLREVVAILVNAKLIAEVAETLEHYVPSRDPTTLTPWDVLSTLRHHDDLDLGIIKPQDTLATVLMGQVEAAGQQVATAQSVTQWLTEKAATPRGS